MYNRTIKKEEEIDLIIVYKQDRLSRNTLDTLYVMHRLKSLDKHLISIADNINTADSKGEILVHIMSLVAQPERDSIAFRTGSGMEKKADEGEFLGGKVFGYNSINKKLIVDDSEPRIVKYIFDKYAIDRWGYRKIASNLNTQGIKTKHKNKWQICSVQTVLKNKTYIGYSKWRGKYTKGKHKAIIEKSLWDETVRLMQQRSYEPQKIHPGSYPLSGLLKCPQCGSSMVQGNSGQKYKYYQCNQNNNSGSAACASNLVKKEYAEDYVVQELLKQFNDNDFISALYASTKSNQEYS